MGRWWGTLVLVAAGCGAPAIPDPTPDLAMVLDLAMAPSCTPAQCKGTPQPLCDAASGSCVACLTDDDCPSGELCAKPACVPGCTPAHGCPDGGSGCVHGGCGPCAHPGDCNTPAYPRCDPHTGLCVACLGDGDCPVEKPTCVNGDCT